MFFVLLSFVLGMYCAQEYDRSLPRIKILFTQASVMLQSAIKGEDEKAT